MINSAFDAEVDYETNIKEISIVLCDFIEDGKEDKTT